MLRGMMLMVLLAQMISGDLQSLYAEASNHATRAVASIVASEDLSAQNKRHVVHMYVRHMRMKVGGGLTDDVEINVWMSLLAQSHKRFIDVQTHAGDSGGNIGYNFPCATPDLPE
jgi:hypothetical protein